MNELVETSTPIPNNDYFENYSVSIEPLTIGCIVRVGCKSFAFETTEKMLEKVNDYFKNPKEKQDEFFKKGTI